MAEIRPHERISRGSRGSSDRASKDRSRREPDSQTTGMRGCAQSTLVDTEFSSELID
jgi:hypothetical protein